MGSNFLATEIPLEDVEPTTIEFGEWLPDLPEHDNPGALEALNVIPSEGCYVPFPEFFAHTGTTLPDIVRGGAVMFLPNSVVEVYLGTVNGIFVGHPTGTYAGAPIFTQQFTAAPLLAENAWQFIRVNDKVVAVHPQVVTGSANVGGASAFAPLGGSPPTAGCGAFINEFLVLGNLTVDPDAASASFPSRIRWGGFNNIDAPWITNPATQADFQDMPAAGGPVKGIIGREVGYVFQERMISRLRYTGLPAVFTIETVEDKRGALGRDSIVDIGTAIFFPSEDGFFMFNGTNTVPIGDNKINRYFFNRLKYVYRDRIVGAVDFSNGCIHWAFPTDSSGALNEMLIYSYRENRWSHALRVVELILSSAVSSISLDDLNDAIENYPTSFDSVAYQTGGRQQLSGVDTTHTYGMFTGIPAPATIDTGEYSGPNYNRVFVNGATPDIDLSAPLATLQLMTRDQMFGEPPVFGSAVAQEIHGEAPVLGDGRAVRLRVNIPSVSWRHAKGICISRKASGIV